MNKTSSIVCAMVLAALLQASGFSGSAIADTILDADAAGKWITDYWTTDEYKNQMNKAVGETPQAIFNRCSTSHTSPVAVYFLAPFTTDGAGKLKSGMWKESYAFSGCGNDSSLNFIFKANEAQKVTLMVALPGESRASAILQHDALSNVDVAAHVHMKTACDKLVIINTTVGKIENKQLIRIDPKSVIPKTVWNEVWTVSACGQKMLVPVEFIPDVLTKPDATGTTFVVHASEIEDQ